MRKGHFEYKPPPRLEAPFRRTYMKDVLEAPLFHKFFENFY